MSRTVIIVARHSSQTFFHKDDISTQRRKTKQEEEESFCDIHLLRVNFAWVGSGANCNTLSTEAWEGMERTASVMKLTPPVME
jgi:hypothetical protein